MLKKTMRRANVRFTYNDYLQLPEDKRYEIIDGELFVVPSPSIEHQRVGLRLKLALFTHVRDHGAGEVLDAPCDVVLSDENVVQPDILFICGPRHHIVGPANVRGAPDLVIEILSPTRRGTDPGAKKKIYARFGVQEYWIVDPEGETVEVLVWNESGYVSAGVHGKADRLSSPLLPELNLPLSEIFKNQ